MSELFDEMAQEIVDDIGDSAIVPISVASVSSWLENNLPALNLKLYSCFTEETLKLCPQAQEIYKQMYLVNYAGRNAQYVLSGAAIAGGSGILSLKDGTSAVTFANRNEIAKSLISFWRAAKELLDDLVSAYLKRKTKPGQLVGEWPINGI